MIFIVLIIFIYFGTAILQIPKILGFVFFMIVFLGSRYLEWRFPKYQKQLRYLVQAVNILSYTLAIAGVYYLWQTISHCQQSLKLCVIHFLV